MADVPSASRLAGVYTPSWRVGGRPLRLLVDLAEGRASVGPVEIDPAVTARQGGAVGLSVSPGPQERLQVSGRQLLFGEGVAQLLVDAYRQRAGSGKDRRVTFDEQIVSAPVAMLFRRDRRRLSANSALL